MSGYCPKYVEWGDGPAAVLVPGLAGGLDLVQPLGEAIGNNFHTFSYELRGEDELFALRRRYEMADLVEDLAEFIDGFGLEQPLIVGVSFGGAIAMEFAARYPGRLSGLAVQGVDARYHPTLVRSITSRVLRDYPLPTDNAFVNQFFNLAFGGRSRDRTVFNFVTRNCWQTDQSVMARRFQLAEELDISPRLDRIRVPTLLLSGDRDVFVSQQGVDELAAGISHVESATVDGAGHLAFVTHAQPIAGRIKQFALDHALIPDA